MSVTLPFRRTCRQFVDGSYADGGKWAYVEHADFAKNPEHYTRAFRLIQKDLLELFDYVEPADANLATYSYRIHELLLRACVEVEANCKAILVENGYPGSPRDFDMKDYWKVNRTHRLSSYQIKFPVWHGAKSTRTPFSAWNGTTAFTALPWYSTYNRVKHDRHDAFASASFDAMLDAICGLLVLLSAQFWKMEFDSTDMGLSLAGPPDGTEQAIGGYFRVKFADDWSPADRYDFDWNVVKTQPNKFQSLTF